jgi:hypothetical protein
MRMALPEIYVSVFFGTSVIHVLFMLHHLRILRFYQFKSLIICSTNNFLSTKVCHLKCQKISYVTHKFAICKYNKCLFHWSSQFLAIKNLLKS